MNNEKIMEKQAFIEEVANYLQECFPVLNPVGCAQIVEEISKRYEIKPKKAFLITYTKQKLVYASNSEEASEIFDNITLNDMDVEGKWCIEEK